VFAIFLLALFPKAVIEAAVRAAGTGTERREPSALAFCLRQRCGDETQHPSGCRNRRAGVLWRQRQETSGSKTLRPLGTDEQKSFLETAPWLIAIFIERQGKDEARQ
jgi:hypothetical protein